MQREREKDTARLDLFKKLGMIWKNRIAVPRALYEKIREINLYGIHEILEAENPRVLERERYISYGD